jgi:hypothetical protein
MKDVQATKKASSPHKRLSSISKQDLYFSFLWVPFALNLDPDLDPTDQNQYGSARNRIRIVNTGFLDFCIVFYETNVLWFSLVITGTSQPASTYSTKRTLPPHPHGR